MIPKSDSRARAADLRARFEARGATPVEVPILQPAETLLDLYGEDIRARAYVTSDALRGEQMLRPDFTVPLVQDQIAQGASEARVTYAGEVFRRQEADPDRANEYIQVGFEILGGADPAAADAEVFAALSEPLAALGLTPVTGDIGLLMAAVDGLSTSPARRAALHRHLWRPRRFRALLDRFADPAPQPHPALTATCDAPQIGRRRAAEIDARLDALRADAKTPPLPDTEVAQIDALLAIRAPLPDALTELAALDMPAIATAIARVAARAEALTGQGIDISLLPFEASYGRSSMEYYDGFVFGFSAPDRPHWPEIATGGRYDALTRALGADLPATGGVLRPDLMLTLERAGGTA